MPVQTFRTLSNCPLALSSALQVNVADRVGHLVIVTIVVEIFRIAWVCYGILTIKSNSISRARAIITVYLINTFATLMYWITTTTITTKTKKKRIFFN
jgi:hypothetical protein